MAYWTRCCQEQITAQQKQIEELTALVNELRARNTDDSK
jgi:cell division protein FtsB